MDGTELMCSLRINVNDLSDREAPQDALSSCMTSWRQGYVTDHSPSESIASWVFALPSESAVYKSKNLPHLSLSGSAWCGIPISCSCAMH